MGDCWHEWVFERETTLEIGAVIFRAYIYKCKHCGKRKTEKGAPLERMR